MLAASLSGRGPLTAANAAAPLRALAAAARGPLPDRGSRGPPAGGLQPPGAREASPAPGAPPPAPPGAAGARPRCRKPLPVPPGLLPHPPGAPPVRPARAAVRVRRVLLQRGHAARRGARHGAGRRVRRGHAHLRRRAALRHPVQRRARAGPGAGRRRGPGFPVHLPHPARPLRAAPAGLPDLPDLRGRSRGPEPARGHHDRAAPGPPAPPGRRDPGRARPAARPLPRPRAAGRDRRAGPRAARAHPPPGGAARLRRVLRRGPVPRAQEPPGLDPGGGGADPGRRTGRARPLPGGDPAGGGAPGGPPGPGCGRSPGSTPVWRRSRGKGWTWPRWPNAARRACGCAGRIARSSG